MKNYLHKAWQGTSAIEKVLGLFSLVFTLSLLTGDPLGLLGLGGCALAVGSPTVNTGSRDRTTSYISANREDTDFETGIALLDPNVNPATLATMEVSKGTVGTIDFHWFEDELVPEIDVLNDATVVTATTDIVVTNITRFAVGDLVRVELTGEVMLVTGVAVTTASTIDVTRDFGQSAESWTALVDSIANGSTLRVIGNAFEQGHTVPTIRSTVEVEYKNYCQDFRTPFGISEVSAAAAHRGVQDWPYQRNKARITHTRKLELSFWWGKPYAGDKGYYSPTTGNTAPGSMGGVDHFIREYTPSDQKLDETELTSDEFQNFMEWVFQYGSSTKVCYCSPRLRTALDKWGISKLNTFTKDTMFGMAVGTWLSSHGTVIFVTHKMFTKPEATDYYYAFFLDMAELKWNNYSDLGSTRLRRMKPYEATGETGKKEEYQSISGVKFGLAPLHSRLRFKTIGT